MSQHRVSEDVTLEVEPYELDPAAEAAAVAPTARQPLPTREEFERAAEAVLRDGRLGAVAGAARPYRPMPPYVDQTLPDGNVGRLVTVGLHDPNGAVQHRIVGVRLGDGAVVDDLDGVPLPSAHSCEPTPPVDACPDPGGPASVRLHITKAGTRLWDLVVVRPRDSSGTNGSGVELRWVDYRGQRVLDRAHVPILNVLYGSAGQHLHCGPSYRDWLNQEACLKADGTEPYGAGFRVCSSAPQTILESGVDDGNFRGVAIWYSAGELRLVSELAAGWYRYVSDWRLLDDGRILPRFGFAATANPCTCSVHNHHAYWRLDLDIRSTTSQVVDEHNDPPEPGSTVWHQLKQEVKRGRRSTLNRFWRVRQHGTSTGYDLVPGPHDGTPDAFGVGDVWILRNRESELDDGQGFTTDPALAKAAIDKFVSGESVQNTDVVLWYAGHFTHDESDPTPHPHVVGPELRPVNW